MKYIRLFLKGFKPLLYGGIKQLEISDMSQIVILSGENGKGKSSVLRELSPYPAVRSDYEKNGLKVIEIQHGSDYYVLTSDFSKTGAHSFVRNDEELNISGTTDVQEDLVQHYFDQFTPMIEKLTSGQYRFSQMGKPERSKLIMATYPSSMLFVLDKYKNLMSKIRACNNQLKLVNERKLKLTESFIDNSQLENYNRQRKLMNDAINSIDQDIFMMKKYIEPIIQEEDYRTRPNYDKDMILQKCKEIRKKFVELSDMMHQKKIEWKDPDTIEMIVEVIKTKIDACERNQSDLDLKGKEILEEIEQYHKYLSTDKDQAIEDCKFMIEIQNDIIRSYKPDPDIPVVDHDEIESMRSYAPELQKQLDYLHGLNIELWSEDQFVEQDRTCRSMVADLSTLKKQKDVLEQDYAKLNFRRDKYLKHPSAPGCVQKCQLRESMDQIIKSIEIEMSSIIDTIKKINKDISLTESRVNELKTALEGRSAARPIIDHLERWTHNKSWGDFITSQRTFVNAANSDITEIYNRYLRVIKSSEANEKVKKAIEQKSILDAKLLALTTDQQPAKQVITSTLIKRESELKTITQKRSSISKQLDQLRDQEELYTKYKSMIDAISCLEDRWDRLRSHLELHAIVDFVQEQIDYLRSTRSDIITRLNELDRITKEQENLRTRLNEEIEPIIKDLSEQLRKWRAIEKVLSPTKGIPNERIVKYINAIFQKANTFIRNVWNYEMELEYLQENEECDYTFRVLINGDGVVKDIHTCSKGQKEIIDLAIMLAICRYRKYSSMFPIKLDEMSSGLSPDHSSKLFEYLGEMFHQSNIMQGFIVNHDPVITSSYTDASYAVLSEDQPLPSSCRIITHIK